MASIKRLDGPRGPRWQVRYRDPNGEQKAQNFDRAQTAREFAARVEHDRRAGSYVNPSGPRTPVPEVVERWKQSCRHGATTVAARDADLRKWVLPQLGRYRIGQVGEPELSALLAAAGEALAPATVERVWAWVTGVFGYAVRARLLAVNPATGLAPPPAPKRTVRPLEGDQVEAAIAALPAWYRTAAILGADAGLRQGEVFGLALCRVGLRALRERILAVERQLVTLPGQRPFLKLPKGEKTRRVPIPDSVADSLAAHLAAYPAGARAADRVSGGEELLVFATSRGAPITRNLVQDVWARAVARAGLPAGTRFHDLRHYYASVLIDAGSSEREIGRRLGHSSVEVTQRYGDLLDRAEDRTRAAVEAEVARRRGVR